MIHVYVCEVAYGRHYLCLVEKSLPLSFSLQALFSSYDVISHLFAFVDLPKALIISGSDHSLVLTRRIIAFQDSVTVWLGYVKSRKANDEDLGF